MAQNEENTNVVGYVGARINSRAYKRYLGQAKLRGATNPPKGTKTGDRHGGVAALQYFYLEPALKYVPVPRKQTDRAAEITEAMKNREAVALRAG